jgi:hypothetical protein
MTNDVVRVHALMTSTFVIQMKTCQQNSGALVLLKSVVTVFKERQNDFHLLPENSQQIYEILMGRLL